MVPKTQLKFLPQRFPQSVVTASFTLATTEFAMHVAESMIALEERGIAAFA